MDTVAATDAGKAVDELPAGYRQGIITAITVFIGFSLLFLRFWSFEASGDWTVSSAIAAGLMVIAIMLEIVALWRSLQVKDSQLVEYNKILKWFLFSVVTMLVSLLFAAVAYTGILSH
jgi:hypothetical protein